jgi:hypothetical protein
MTSPKVQQPSIELGPISRSLTTNTLARPKSNTEPRDVAYQDVGALEQNNGSSSVQEDIDTKARKTKAHAQFFSLCLAMFLAGWNDGSNGPLIPKIQSVYHVRCLSLIDGIEVLTS